MNLVTHSYTYRWTRIGAEGRLEPIVMRDIGVGTERE